MSSATETIDTSSNHVRENYENISDFRNTVSSKYNSVSTISIALSLAVIFAMVGWLNYSLFLGSTTSAILIHMRASIMESETAKSNIVNDSTVNGFYMFLFNAIVLFAYIFGLYYKVFLNGTQDRKAAGITAICIAAILGITSIFTSPIVSSRVVDIVRIFENTVGYTCISIFCKKKLTTIMDLLYTNEMYPKMNSFPLSMVNYGFLLTTFDIYNFVTMSKSVGYRGQSVYNFHICDDSEILAKINPGDKGIVGGAYKNIIKGGTIIDVNSYQKDLEARIEQYDDSILNVLESSSASEENSVHLTDVLISELAKLVVLKNMIGHMCWTYLASIITVLISLKYLSANI